ncbi:MAG TPA: prolyl aminopeptidase [Verrucomicrobiae bacterium]|nr:prolyl aminopeptidase [Verrucomicrobiae bacterium]
MSYTASVAEESDWKYPEPDEMVGSGWLPVASGHEIYWHEYGNPLGEPVMFLHGGPGGGTSPKQARFFNPRRYRIILFDQRGCGKSRPTVASPDPQTASAALVDNTTDHLIADIEALRAHLGVKGPMHVFGGSWGSTLSLAYAIRYPDSVKTLILRGIFLCRRKDLDYFYQGNAQVWDPQTGDTSLPGTYLFFPEAWKTFVEVIEPAKRGDMVKAYAEIFEDSKHPRLQEAATAWSVYEGSTSYLAPEKDLSSYAEPEFALAFARIENHYFMNGAFLGGTNRDNNYLLENAGVIAKAKIPVYIVQGQFDQVCPRFQADDLYAALKDKTKVTYVVTTAGHSQFDRETAKALTEIMDKLSGPVAKG